ncbi:ribonuclease 3-like [Artemia franciscana]|uniref:Ribonuclease 3 n=1 Tax=Artemia franciscana TaxID=6661 RepID=A0AA88I5U9_ARTSF|nr:hypothetical protein QYM36_006038 [Artemia franciscana]
MDEQSGSKGPIPLMSLDLAPCETPDSIPSTACKTQSSCCLPPKTKSVRSLNDIKKSNRNSETTPSRVSSKSGNSDAWIENLSNSRRNYNRFLDRNSDEMMNLLEDLSSLSVEEIISQETKTWTRTCPADLYYERTSGRTMVATQKLKDLCSRFYSEIIAPGVEARKAWPSTSKPFTKIRKCTASCKGDKHDHSSDSSGTESEDGEFVDEKDKVINELNKKQNHPFRLHLELWHNEAGETNEGPICKCSLKSRRTGIRHNIFVGETTIPKCDPFSNCIDKLYQYRVTLSPPTNFLVKYPTIISHDNHEFIFEGFSLLSHFPIPQLPTCKVIRFNIEYTIIYIEEKLPENYTIRELDLVSEFLFKEILELYDFDLFGPGENKGCPQFHIMPRFVRDLEDNGKEILSMNKVLSYFIRSRSLLVEPENLQEYLAMSPKNWQRYAEEFKEMIATKPGMRPNAVRVDQLDRDQLEPGKTTFPAIVHFGLRPPQLSYAGNPEYQKTWREYVKYRHLLANMPKPLQKDKEKLNDIEKKLVALRSASSMKRDVTIAVSAEGFYTTGIMTDMVQHALLLPVLIGHFRIHRSLGYLEDSIGYKFKTRALLQLALTHPSYRENYGTNPDHARNSLTNCGIRQPQYGDRKIHYQNMRKRGINTLIHIMARFGKHEATESRVTHNERLEFLGDAVVEFVSSIHLFFMFPDVEEGGLATYRAAIVQNQHLAVLARKMALDHFMLYAHGSDLCHDLELRHAMANCFEALMGALFLDGGWEVADRVFAKVFHMDDPRLYSVWTNLLPHPLQEQEPQGDRHLISSYPVLQRLVQFEEATGIRFKHIRLLARAFTDRSIGINNLTLGSNQRMEFLGDTVLQLIASEYLYKHFPDHHEGHLSLLRSSLVNNRTQAVVCDDLGMTKYAQYKIPKTEVKVKDKADLLESFLGAIYVDQGLESCIVFCNVCFFPRLQSFILNQEWNDPKSKLQQCCLTLRTIGAGEPDIPQYKVIQTKGPTNTRIYTVAVYFRGRRLSKASGLSIQSAEMQAATLALENCEELLPQLQYQKQVMSKSLKVQKINKDEVLLDYDTERVHYKGVVEDEDSDNDFFNDKTDVDNRSYGRVNKDRRTARLDNKKPESKRARILDHTDKFVKKFVGKKDQNRSPYRRQLLDSTQSRRGKRRRRTDSSDSNDEALSLLQGVSRVGTDHKDVSIKIPQVNIESEVSLRKSNKCLDSGGVIFIEEKQFNRRGETTSKDIVSCTSEYKRKSLWRTESPSKLVQYSDSDCELSPVSDSELDSVQLESSDSRGAEKDEPNQSLRSLKKNAHRDLDRNTLRNDHIYSDLSDGELKEDSTSAENTSDFRPCVYLSDLSEGEILD